jgi:hypothetical protein
MIQEFETEAYLRMLESNNSKTMVDHYLDILDDTVVLPDGHNGHTKKFFRFPIEVDGDLVKLRCAEPGEAHLIRWARKREITT